MQEIWNFIVTHAKNFWAGIMTFVVAVLTFFGINAAKCDPLKPYIPTTTAIVTTTATPTTPSTTVTEPALPAFSITVTLPGETPVTFNNAAATAAKLTLQKNIVITSKNSKNTVTDYTVTGYKLKDILAACGVDVGALGSTATVKVFSGASNTPYGLDLIKADKTILALQYSSHAVDGVDGSIKDTTESQNAGDCPRMFPGIGTDSSIFIKQVSALELVA
ncbi:MAG: hypothetical protein FWC27_05545 [Firmicutes bacterium]|nr:hypothetical protein [Bacillota bacterium]